MTNNNLLLNELLQNDDFVAWVFSPTEAGNIYWANYATASDAHANAVEKARKLTLLFRESHATEEQDSNSNDIWNRIEQSIHSQANKTIPIHRKKWWWAAAGIAVIASTMGYYFLQKTAPVSLVINTAVKEAKHLIERKNSSGKDEIILLSDGSRVFLAPGSALKSQPIFNDSTREVYLEGEAFFEIAKDPQHPFLVHAHNIVTRVLGTSFRVNARSASNDVTVAVRTGKVAVFTEKENDPGKMVLLPNQQVVINASNNTAVKTAVQDTLLIKQPNYKPLSFEYEDAPLITVLNDLQATYHVQINYNKDKITNCRITTSIGEEPLSDKIRIICSAINATYTIDESSVTILSQGCD
ncbi:FecR domain-containing protein [Danxiaibacter flavus]|uniref:FecR domain-containing protein n=1 Tax=Danxiaibacter flavus TaxID=3049108 RepID=A0ABV3ZMG9_9BACT|nr:FecR domain-containing protein [Chitinophagaceae bacterium DXS]